MDPWVWNKIGLELVEINIEGTIKAQGCCDGRDDLGNQPVQIRVCWSGDLKMDTTKVIYGLIVNQEGHITVFQSCVGIEQSIVGLDNCSCNLSKP